MKFINNVKNAKNNWKTIQASPYASLHFKYKTTLITIILFSAYIIFTIIKITLNYHGFGWQTWLMRFFTLGIGALIVSKALQTLTPIKKAMEPYKKNKKLINHTSSGASKIDRDDILTQFNEDGKRRSDSHLGPQELNSKQKEKPLKP